MCASGSPGQCVRTRADLPYVILIVNGKQTVGLVDTGCSKSVVRRGIIDEGKILTGESSITMMDGSVCSGREKAEVNLEIEGKKRRLECIVVDKLGIDGDILIGCDVLRDMGGMAMDGRGNVKIGWQENVNVANKLKGPGWDTIIEKDFVARFKDGMWIVKWRWIRPPTLRNQIGVYAVKDELRGKFEEELRLWIKEGWLVPYDGEASGVIPILAKDEREVKGKVRPVLDFRELNKFIAVHSADSEICIERLREWRRIGKQAKLVDLSKAYLQIKLDEEVQQVHIVRVFGRLYKLTRVGSGLAIAPNIMTAVVHRVLSLNDKVRAGTSSYMDDILVDETIVNAETVRRHLKQYGLIAKEAAELPGNRVLGLRISEGKDGNLIWGRGKEIPTLKDKITRREIYSWCGKVAGYYPVAGWLRCATSVLKRQCNIAWDEEIGKECMEFAKEIEHRLKGDDPVGGRWNVNKGECMVYSDASSIAKGIVVTIGGVTVEDNCWLKSKNDDTHINVTELEAALAAINTAVDWGYTTLTLCTDSATVEKWLRLMTTGEKRVVVKGLSRKLISHRLGILKIMIEEMEL